MTLLAGEEYVALGSSFAAGPGLRPRTKGAPKASGRSDANYAHLLASRLMLDLRDVTFSGATAADLTAGVDRPAQTVSVGPRTRLVTITAGGNDVGYLPALTLASLPWPARRIPRLRRRVAELIDGEATHRRFTALNGSLTAVVEDVRRRAPEAQLILVDYLQILPGWDEITGFDRKDMLPLTTEVIRWARNTADALSATMASVAASRGASFAPIGELSKDHHAWSDEPWTRRFHLSLRGGAPYHPNAAGMAAVADALARHLTS